MTAMLVSRLVILYPASKDLSGVPSYTAAPAAFGIRHPHTFHDTLDIEEPKTRMVHRKSLYPQTGTSGPAPDIPDTFTYFPSSQLSEVRLRAQHQKQVPHAHTVTCILFCTQSRSFSSISTLALQSGDDPGFGLDFGETFFFFFLSLSFAAFFLLYQKRILRFRGLQEHGSHAATVCAPCAFVALTGLL
jgi:hypothetical protein